MNWLIGFLLGLFGFLGSSGLYIYLCKYYTILKVKDMEVQLSKLTELTDTELELLNSIRDFLENPDESVKNK